MPPLLHAHHIVSLASHLVSVALLHAGVPHYFAGVAALELGSAACNVASIYPFVPLIPEAYVLVLSVLHVFVLLATVRWIRLHASLGTSLAARVYGAVVSIGLVIGREQEGIRAILATWADASR